MRAYLPVLLMVSILCFAEASPAVAQELDGPAIYQKLLHSAVMLHSIPDPKSSVSGHGSGWIVDKGRRLIVTNHHVAGTVEEMDCYFPVFENGQVVAEIPRYHNEFKPVRAKMIHSDPRRDLCILEVPTMPADAEALQLAPQSAVPATVVHCVGNPGGSGAYFVYNTGTVRQVVKKYIDYGDFLVHCRIMECQNPSNPGDSGGPVVNNKCQLIGVITGGIPGLQLMKSSIDVSEVHEFLKEFDSFVEPRLVGDFKRRGQSYLQATRYEKALGDFTRVLELTPEDGEAHLGMAVCLSRTGQHSKAMTSFAAAEKLRPQDSSVFRERGRAWFRMKENEKGLADLSKAIQLDPKDLDALRIRADAYEQLKVMDKAIADWTTLVSLMPESPDMRFRRGKAEWLIDLNDKAVEDYTEAFKLLPHHVFLCHRGMAFRDLKNYEQAIKDLTNSILMSQRYVTAFFVRGDVNLRMGKLQAAVDDLSEAVRLNPDFAEAYFLRSQAFREKGFKELSQADLDKAIALNPALANAKVAGRPSTANDRPESAPPDVVKESVDLETCMCELARDIARAMIEQKQGSVSVGAFTSPPQLPASTGPGLANILANELRKLGAEIGPAVLGVKGEFRDVSDAKAGKLAVRIQADLVGRDGARLGRFARVVRGASNVAPLLGLSVVLPSDRPEREREKQLQDSVDHPQTQIVGTRVTAAPGSPYLVEILVQEPAGLKPRAPKLDDGLAFVDIEKGESYAIRVVNNSEHDAAVTLAIDGLNLFAFSQNREYSYFILAAKSETVIKGWHRTNAASDSFVITDYAKGAAAELGAGGASIGTITCSFAAAWPADQQPPADELSARLGNRGDGKATGRGPVVALNYKEVRRQVGAVRSVVSVRYDKP